MCAKTSFLTSLGVEIYASGHRRWAETRQDAEAAPRTPLRQAARRNRGHLPESLLRVERVIEPDSLLCPCGCGEMHRIGEDQTERLDIVPAQLRVIVTIRPKYAC